MPKAVTMTWVHILAHILLPSAIAITAAFGAWRCWRLLQYAQDPRLTKLMWFYGLFAASLVFMAIWTGQLSAEVAGSSAGMHHEETSGSFGDLHSSFSSRQEVNIFLLAHHILMLVSLGVDVQAFSHKREESTAVHSFILVPLGALAPFIIVGLAFQAAMTLYLAVRAILNHMERRTPGALQVALGFLLFSIGHLGFFIFHQPGAARSPLGDIFALVGIVLLVQLLPRPST